MKVQYVVLDYCPDPNASVGRKIAVVAKPVDNAQEYGLGVYTARDWFKDVEPEDANYVRMILEDVQAYPPDERESVFLQMTKMASGALRTGDQGFCDDRHLAVTTGIDLEI